jgi:hypothetical protein
MQRFDFKKFTAAIKVLIANKQTILTAAQSVENTVQIVYNLCLSVLSAYTSIKEGTSARGLSDGDEDAAEIITQYRKLQ